MSLWRVAAVQQGAYPAPPMITALSDRHIQRTALSLIRTYGANACAEARIWCRHFALEGNRLERAVWTRILLECRRTLRAGSAMALAA
ncbi:hypothetical protein sos41_17490 [Alphaproteobacteria bacterium SO-S41]|nr:hypothetical protein sos41_17490 [Alphaproteobacteria bacterium SO-S41]